MSKHILKVLLSLLASVAVGCATTSEKDISDAEINAQAAKAYQDVKAKSKISQNAEWTAMVQRVSQRIAAASGKPYNWEVILIDNPEPNAWCMPGGKMAVYTGILPILKTEGALAAVMGHEVAHATHNHGKKRYARAINEQATGALLGVGAMVGGALLCKTENCKNLAMLGGAAAGFAYGFFQRKFDRGEESEADQVGQVYMAKAGYEPAEAIQVWERMGAANKGAPPEWMSTHPSDSRRKDQLREWLPQAQSVYASAPKKYGLGQPIVR